MAYKSFINITPSTRAAGVGFLPVPFTDIPGSFTRFNDIIENVGILQLRAVEGNAELLEVGDTVEVVTDDEIYNAQGLVTEVPSENQVRVDIPFIGDAGEGTLTFISRP